MGDELRATTEEEANRLMRAWQRILSDTADSLRATLLHLDHAREGGPPEWLLPPSTAERHRLRADRDAYRAALLAANRRRRTVERIREDMVRTWTPPASPAPETRTAETCSGCGKSISGPRFCLSCLEWVDVTIDAPETRTSEGAAPCGGSRCYLNDDETLWIHSSKSYSSCAVHRQAGDTNLKFTAARAPSPRDGGQP